MEKQILATFTNRVYLQDKMKPYFDGDPNFEKHFVKWYGWLIEKGEARCFPVEYWVKGMTTFIKKNNSSSFKVVKEVQPPYPSGKIIVEIFNSLSMENKVRWLYERLCLKFPEMDFDRADLYELVAKQPGVIWKVMVLCKRLPAKTPLKYEILKQEVNAVNQINKS